MMFKLFFLKMYNRILGGTGGSRGGMGGGTGGLTGFGKKC
jgi:hypothetical protein